ncbi:LacI family DNA-binding transcriptional regulator [uncultured Modestobacter sp.]|uniref:LacI family DNA-binding transcriptional regulator n=1 Tax=uncultured Modestobacter sp. TaxID=380048 RepID=UPI0026287878|nr:substrate-binding domain-containing protein [uncultured Modestobacter sp.]
MAAAAGVSPTTISNAYNRPEQLSEALRERILELAEQMGYSGPDPSASSLRGRRAGSIGVLFAQELTYAFSDPYCAELLTGVAEVATTTGTNVLLMPVGPHSVSKGHSRAEEMRLVQNVRRAVLDGAIADGVDTEHPVLRVLANRGIPIISTVDTGSPCVLVDDRGAAVEVGRHLRELGHRRCAVIIDSMDDDEPVVGVRDESRLFPYARLRLEGLRAGLGPGAEVTPVSAGTNTLESGRKAAAAVLAVAAAAGAQPTVIAATTDVLALGVIDTLRSQGLQVGAEISVTGFDDIPRAEDAGLTTVRQPVREKGRVMARMLVDPTYGQTRVTLPTEVVIRTSTAPAAS